MLVWVPLGIDINVNVPPVDGNGGGGGGRILNSQLDGAFLAGFAVSHRFWKIDVDGLWASFGGDRPDNPTLTVDVSGVDGHGTGGMKVYKDFYATGGVRRYALKYDIKPRDTRTSSEGRACGIRELALPGVVSVGSSRLTPPPMAAASEQGLTSMSQPPGHRPGGVCERDCGNERARYAGSPS